MDSLQGLLEVLFLNILQYSRWIPFLEKTDTTLKVILLKQQEQQQLWFQALRQRSIEQKGRELEKEENIRKLHQEIEESNGRLKELNEKHMKGEDEIKELDEMAKVLHENRERELAK